MGGAGLEAAAGEAAVEVLDEEGADEHEEGTPEGDALVLPLVVEQTGEDREEDDAVDGDERPAAADVGGADTFPRLLLHHAAVRPDAPAIREKDLGIWQSWTWGEVCEQARLLAAGLAAMGFRRGDHLAIIGENRPRLYWSIMAAQALGGVPVPLYQDSIAQELAFVLGDAEVEFAVVEDH